MFNHCMQGTFARARTRPKGHQANCARRWGIFYASSITIILYTWISRLYVRSTYFCIKGTLSSRTLKDVRKILPFLPPPQNLAFYSKINTSVRICQTPLVRTSFMDDPLLQDVFLNAASESPRMT